MENLTKGKKRIFGGDFLIMSLNFSLFQTHFTEIRNSKSEISEPITC